MSQYPSNDAAIKLLNALCSNPSCGRSTPSNSVIQLISHIESADPNNPELDEDDLGLSWGHAQYKGWSTYLRTWQDIGTPETACSLIAAFVKTSKVARYLCQQKNIDIEGKTLLSDSYLTELTEKLWQLWQNAMNTNDNPSIGGGQPKDVTGIPGKFLVVNLAGNTAKNYQESTKTPEGCYQEFLVKCKDVRGNYQDSLYLD
ncbi:hypothetical protein JOM56_004672 [Amanita muscaria]